MTAEREAEIRRRAFEALESVLAALDEATLRAERAEAQAEKLVSSLSHDHIDIRDEPAGDPLCFVCAALADYRAAKGQA